MARCPQGTAKGEKHEPEAGSNLRTRRRIAGSAGAESELGPLGMW